MNKRGSLPELVRLFLRLGVTAFGGPAAHIALMEHEVVRRRQWIARAEFLDYLGATNLIPGPNSTELAMHIGHVRAGGAGLAAAGVSFILPAAIIVAVLASAYVRYGAMPNVASVLYGIKPVAIALVLQALWGLSRTAVKGPLHLVAAVGAISAAIFGVHELIVLVAAGLFVLAVSGGRRQRRTAAWGGLSMLAGGTATTTAASAAIPTVAMTTGSLLVTLFLTLLKIGSVIFGSGYVLLAFLR